ncbi:hypothetical protein ACWCQ0_53875 [Streptomyces massasporeus]
MTLTTEEIRPTATVTPDVVPDGPGAPAENRRTTSALHARDVFALVGAGAAAVALTSVLFGRRTAQGLRPPPRSGRSSKAISDSRHPHRSERRHLRLQRKRTEGRCRCQRALAAS